MSNDLLRRARNKRGRLRGSGGCLRCGDTWDWKTYHVTNYTEDGAFPRHGCFPLCEECWSSLTPETRLPYYAMLMKIWITNKQPSQQWTIGSLDKWPAIRDAVLQGG